MRDPRELETALARTLDAVREAEEARADRAIRTLEEARADAFEVAVEALRERREEAEREREPVDEESDFPAEPAELRISGQLTDSDGNGLPAVRVRLVGNKRDGDIEDPDWVTDDAGRFRIALRDKQLAGRPANLTFEAIDPSGAVLKKFRSPNALGELHHEDHALELDESSMVVRLAEEATRFETLRRERADALDAAAGRLEDERDVRVALAEREIAWLRKVRAGRRPGRKSYEKKAAGTRRPSEQTAPPAKTPKEKS